MIIAAVVIVIIAIAIAGQQRQPTIQTASSQMPVPDSQPAEPSQMQPTDVGGVQAQPTAQQPPDTAAQEADREEAARQGIQSTLDDWAGGVNNQDLDQHTNAYAERVAPYFNRDSASRDEIRDTKARAFDGRYSSMSLSISDVDIRVDGGWATVTLSKSWTFNGTQTYSGSCRQELRMREMTDGWKITSESESDVTENRY